MNERMPVPAPVPATRRFEASICDRANPKSLVNLLPAEYAAKVEKIPDDLLRLSEAEYCHNYPPEPVLTRLKLRLWSEWQEAAAGPPGTKIRMSDVYGQQCSLDFFRDVFDEPYLLVWVVLPPATDQMQMEELFFSGLRQIQEILAMPNYEDGPTPKKGLQRGIARGKQQTYKKPNIALIKEKREWMKWLGDRVHGAMVQRQQLDARILAITQTGDQHKKTIAAPTGTGLPPMSPSEVLASLERQMTLSAPEIEQATVDAEHEDV